MKIGPYQLPNAVLLAPMAGVTDQPFRKLCRQLGAGLVVSEMVISDSRLWNTRKSKLRLDHRGEPEPRSVQIAGGDPEMMAEAAKLTVANGAQIVDINMGCPAKKVCKKQAGSALLKDEALVESILTAVVNAVDVPVTLKMRTGWDTQHRNGVTIARIAEDVGIQSLAVHGRTRACAYKGEVEYDTIAAIKESVSIPVVANGDINSPEKAKEVLDHTAADGIMIGRSAQGNPWIFREIAHYLASGEQLPPPSLGEVKQVMMEHLSSLHSFYGEYLGIRIARKHLGWYVQNLPEGANFRKSFNLLDSAQEQLASAQGYFERLIKREVMAA
ncbi:MAG: tRNA dihydrouridine synthase DusB [Pseudomonadales bacterium]|nr:tRNA dihydrouridine synthase DusB [Pseudomonadales bacterium]